MNTMGFHFDASRFPVQLLRVPAVSATLSGQEEENGRKSWWIRRIAAFVITDGDA